MIMPDKQIGVDNMHHETMVGSNLKSVDINLFHCRRRSFSMQPIASEVFSYEVRFHLETDDHCTIQGATSNIQHLPPLRSAIT